MSDFNTRFEDELIEPLKCMDRRDGNCRGPVEYRESLSGTGTPMKRCDGHHEKRLEKQREIEERYAPNSDVPPEGFDPTFAGERWDEEY